MKLKTSHRVTDKNYTRKMREKKKKKKQAGHEKLKGNSVLKEHRASRCLPMEAENIQS